MLIIIGKTASGKDSVVKELVKKHGFKKFITYTTRPKRKNEKEGVTYHYVSEEDFLNKVDSGFFLEYKSYETEFGTWYYGSAKEDYRKADSKTVIILTPDGYRDLLRELPEVAHKSIYLYANIETIKKRLNARGDDKSEAERRVLHDNSDFKGLEMEVHRIIYNHDGYDLDSVVDRIVTYLDAFE